MPIEIRELVIKAEVGNNRRSANTHQGTSKGDKQQIVQECVDKVLEILKEKRER